MFLVAGSPPEVWETRTLPCTAQSTTSFTSQGLSGTSGIIGFTRLRVTQRGGPYPMLLPASRLWRNSGRVDNCWKGERNFGQPDSR